MKEVSTISKNFYPRPPRGGRRNCNNFAGTSSKISIHALREEGDLERSHQGGARPISIHALREEGDAAVLVFYELNRISIHALREEGDTPSAKIKNNCVYFYPRPPRGGRLLQDCP